MVPKFSQTATFSVIRNCAPGVNGSQSLAPLVVLYILGPIPPATSPLLSLPAQGPAVWDYALSPSQRVLNLLEKKSTAVAGWLNQGSGKHVWVCVIGYELFHFVLCMFYQSNLYSQWKLRERNV
jgi:hypothetical protein